MWFLALIATAVSGIFSALVARQWLGRRRPHFLAWAAALAMFAIASLAATVGMVGQWSPEWYRVYYLFGAIVNVPVLGLGSVYLLSPRRAAAHVCAVVVVVACVGAALAVATADLRPRAATALTAQELPGGHEVMPSGVRLLARVYSFAGFVLVVGGAVWSALRLARTRRPQLKGLVAANLLIAAGTSVVAIGSGFAFYGEGWPFSVGLSAGVCLMFWGFLKTQTQARQRLGGGQGT
jgi:hypothetical protein